MSTAITTPDPAASIAEQVAIAGDLSKLSPQDRMLYYGEVCRSMGLNPLTRPFQYITLNNKLTLYATRDATDQLRRLRSVSITIVGRERLEDVYVVTARATTPDGRTDESTGVVSIGNLRGDNLANALMKAETKAKRRVTMSICGLGWLDESELETVRDARAVAVNDKGVIEDQPPDQGQNGAGYSQERSVLLGALRVAVDEALAAGADIKRPGQREVAGWDDQTVRDAITALRAAKLEAERRARQAELDAIDAAVSK